MLPQSLSSDACSLNPGVERLAVTAEIELDGDGRAPLGELLPLADPLRRAARLRRPRPDLRRPRARPRSRSPSAIEVARAAAAALEAPTAARGLEVSGSEPEFSFADDGAVEAARVGPETEAHRLIERLMILTNEQVAHAARAQAGADALPGPRAARSRRASAFLIEQLASLDVPTPAIGELAGPSEAGEVARRGERARRPRGRAARPRRRSLSSLVLRVAEARPLQRANARPRRARQPRLRPLHLADPPLSRPDRPPGPALRGRRLGGAPGRARGRRRRRCTARTASASR